MADQMLLAGSVGDLLRTTRLLALAIEHPLVALGAVLWFAAAYGCAKVAARKGHDEQLWGFFGLLFGIITLIVVLAVPINKADRTGHRSPPRQGGTSRLEW